MGKAKKRGKNGLFSLIVVLLVFATVMGAFGFYQSGAYVGGNHSNTVSGELEIHYILRYGLGDDEDEEATDFIGQLENNISRMKAKQHKFTIQRSVYVLIMLTAYTAIIGSWIYVLFKYFV